MAETSALISHERTNTCQTESRQTYGQMISLSALERITSTLQAEIERLKAERDKAGGTISRMAEYIVTKGRVDYFLCDEIPKAIHLKYQPKNDGNYENEPCIKCVAEYFTRGLEETK